MKKISMLAIMCAATISGALATTNGTAMGGFVGGENVVLTIQQAKSMKDDSKVLLEGSIVQKNGHEKYLFQDSTGTIMVEIDDDDWHGLVVSPTDTVRIYGEVDRGLFKTEIDVDLIQKM